MKITRLAVNGKAQGVAISPDGKWVAYVSRAGVEQSLWIRQVATNSNAQIVPPANVHYGGPKFSQDGNYVYYVATEPNNPAGILYQIPSLGGPPRKILDRVDSAITFSPDANRIAFLRDDVVASGENQLIVVNADGTGERKLAARKGDTWFSEVGCGWSPDGKTIACPGGSYSGGIHQTVIAIDVETGQQNDLARQRFRQGPMGAVSWLADGSGVVVGAAEPESLGNQLWLVSYPSGEGHKITNDLNEYSGSSLTADSQLLVSVRNDTITNIWTAPSGDAAHAKQITSGKSEGNGKLAWTPDGRIVYTSLDSGNANIWIMKNDGSGQKQLTTGHANNPAVSTDGRYIVFVSRRAGLPSLWRMDLDGGNLKQLTDQQDLLPQISPDSQWIVFDSWRSAKRNLWKISIDGGQPVQISDKFTSSSGISPDGKLIACFYKDEQASASWRIMILPFEGGPPLKTFDMPSPVDRRTLDAAITWTPDGRGVAYIDSMGGTPNLWSQSLEGGSPKKLTDFKENGVSQHAWSRDGKQLAFTRATTTSDVVLIRDFR